MTKIKKVLGMMMAALMCFALTPAAAFAAEGDANGKITVEKAQPGETYTLYKLADLVTDASNTAFIYTAAPGTQSFWDWAANGNKVEGPDAVAAIPGIKFDKASGKIDVDASLTDNAEAAADLAKIAASQLGTFVTSGVWSETQKCQKIEGSESTEGTVVFENLEKGYYFLASSTGTICQLTTMSDDITVFEKNDVPTLDKKVSDQGQNNWVDANSASVGDIVDFKSKVKIPKGNKGLVYHDAMDTGLELVGGQQGVKVYLSNEDGDIFSTLEELNGYSVSLTNLESVPEENIVLDNCTFEVKFDDDVLENEVNADRFANNQYIYVIIMYSAQVKPVATEMVSSRPDATNTNANTYAELVNKAKVTYGNEGTLESLTQTFLGSLMVTKMNGDGTKKLEGAVFTLGTLKVVLDETWTMDSIPTYRPAVEGEEGSFEITSPEGGVFRVTGLKQGSYQLIEQEAPAGYNKVTEPVIIQINPIEDRSGDVAKLDGLTDGFAEVYNNSGAELPSTGGMGTTILYVIGGALVIAAIAFLVVRRRSSAK